MAAVTVQSVTKQFGTQVVLQEVSLELQVGQTVGLVGANGAGKTTLFRLITGELTSDLGTVTRARGVEIGYLPQEPGGVPERTLHDEVFSVFADLLALERKLHGLAEEMAHAGEGPELTELMERYERVNTQFIAAGGHNFETRLKEILGGLGFTTADYDQPMRVLSGGQKCRASLAKVLLEDRSFLLLDEPTNHLDIDAVRWLEKFLAGHHGGAVIISHDRYLLDRLCDRILETESRKVASFPGNYTNYAETKYRRALTQQRQYEKDSAFIEKERDYIRRNLTARRTKVAKGRRTRLERRLAAGEFVTEAPSDTKATKFSFQRIETRGGPVLRCEDLAMAFDDNVLYRDLNLQVNAGERVGITGPNGTGKTTLLRNILGTVAPNAGKVVFDHEVSVGYYAQEHVDLDPRRTVLAEVRHACPNLTELEARSLLGSYRFRGDDVFKTLGTLSGGEQSRVRLATLILGAPELLVLDEPTNHLDIPAREALEQALSTFTGTILVVSHDRYFLDRIVDRLLVLRTNEHRVYAGNYSYYIQQLEEQRAAEQTRATGSPRRARRSASVAQKPKRPRSPYDHLSVEQIEELLTEREDRLSQLSARFGAPEIYKDAAKLAGLRAESEVLQQELAEIEAAWEERAEDQ